MVELGAGELICNTLMKRRKEGENITEGKAKIKERKDERELALGPQRDLLVGDILTSGLISGFYSLALSLLLM